RTPVSSSQTMSRRPLSTNISLTQRWPMFPGLLAALALGHAPGTVERRREPTRYVHMYFVKWVSSSKPMKPYSADWYLWTSDSRSQYPFLAAGIRQHARVAFRSHAEMQEQRRIAAVVENHVRVAF